MEGFLLGFFVRIFVVILVICLYIKKVVKKELLLKGEDGIADISLKVISAGILIWLFFGSIVPMIQDIPYIVTGDYNVIEGTAQFDTGASRLGDISVDIKSDDTQTIVNVTFPYVGSIKEGDHLTVYYLPHSTEGFLGERNGTVYHTVKSE